MNSVNQHTKFDQLYNKLIQEINVAGGMTSVFGVAAGDGDTSTGWGDSSDVRLPFALGGVTRKKRKKKRKKSKKRKKVKESDTVAHTKGPVQSRPPIERVFGFQENMKPETQQDMLPNDPLKQIKPKQLTQRELDMIVNQSVGLLNSVPPKDFNRVVNKLMQQLNKAKQQIRKDIK